MRALKVFLAVAVCITFLINSDLYAQVAYDIQYESSFLKVHIWEDSMQVERYIYEYDAMPTATPSGMRVERRHRRLTTAERQALSNCVEVSGFLRLNREAYGAGESQRFYPYRIRVVWNESAESKAKEVLYRSSPGAEKPPAAFSILENCIIRLVKSGQD